LLLYRLYLIEYQKKAFNVKRLLEFKELSNYISEKNLHGIDLPQDHDSFENFIIKMKLKKIISGANDSYKRTRHRKPNPFVS